MQTNHIRCRHQLVDIAPTKTRLVRNLFFACVGGDHAHSHRYRDLGHVSPYPAEPYDTHRLPL
jgi:hypothetical protein